MKKCSRCKELKDESEFNNNKKRYDGLQTYCRVCQRILDKDYYDNNISRRKKMRSAQKKRYYRNKEYIYQYLLSHPCVDCGETNPVVLGFDHIKGEKDFDIASEKLFSIKRIQEEIGKCEVRCANCHLIRTARENEFYIYRRYNNNIG